MRRILLLAFTVVLGVAATAGPAAAAPPGVVVVSTAEQGILRDSPGTILGRDVGASTRLDGRVRWVFGDTLFIRSAGTPANPADDWRSATHATSSLSNPWQLTNVLDTGTGVPYQVLPYTSAELAYNRDSANPSNRYALWPSSIITRSTTRAQIIYSSVLIGEGELNYTNVGVGIAELTAGANAATRSGLLFTGDDPRFGASGGFLDRDGTTLYLYDCWLRGTFDYPCRVARVSVRTASGAIDWNRTKVRANYRAAVRNADGSIGWSPTLSSATEVVQGSTTGWSVAWNAGVGKYVAFASVPLTDRIELRTADRPEGPWSDAAPVATGLAPSCWPGTLICNDYAVQQHAELAVHGSGTSTVYLTYARPMYSTASPFRGDLNVVRVNLRRA
jgi:hypothetical protein